MTFTQTEQSVSAIDRIGDGWVWLFHSPFFSVLKFFAAVYVTVLIVSIIILLFLINARDEMRKSKRGAKVHTHVEVKRKWRRIMSRLKKSDPQYYKVAILEADQMIERLLDKIGYKKPTMAEKISLLERQMIDSAAQLREAHEVCAAIVSQRDFTLTREEAERTLAQYETFLRDMELFEK